MLQTGRRLAVAISFLYPRRGKHEHVHRLISVRDYVTKSQNHPVSAVVSSSFQLVGS